MTPEQFCYWLQGYAELNQAGPTPEQWKAIKEHLQTVFHKVTPQVSGPMSWPRTMPEPLRWPEPTIICGPNGAAVTSSAAYPKYEHISFCQTQ